MTIVANTASTSAMPRNVADGPRPRIVNAITIHARNSTNVRCTRIGMPAILPSRSDQGSRLGEVAAIVRLHFERLPARIAGQEQRGHRASHLVVPALPLGSRDVLQLLDLVARLREPLTEDDEVLVDTVHLRGQEAARAREHLDQE